MHKNIVLESGFQAFCFVGAWPDGHFLSCVLSKRLGAGLTAPELGFYGVAQGSRLASGLRQGVSISRMRVTQAIPRHLWSYRPDERMGLRAIVRSRPPRSETSALKPVKLSI